MIMCSLSEYNLLDLARRKQPVVSWRYGEICMIEAMEKLRQTGRTTRMLGAAEDAARAAKNEQLNGVE